MILFKNSLQIQDFLKKKRLSSLRTGFVPTMGALHKGHLSLLERSKNENNLTICSIFVNPTQFNDPDDYKKYPVTIEQDIYLLENSGCDLLFMPSVMEIYPDGIENLNHYNLGYLELILEGKYRPGHFQGVCQVVHKLLEIVMPDHLYLGQKDFQQCMVIKKLIELIGLSENINTVICPTFRESNGLAMSSRNQRLTEEEREKAATISAALKFIKDNLKPGTTELIKMNAEQMLTEKGFEIDYLEIADAETLQGCKFWDGKSKIMALAAAIINKVRLIDNMIIN